MSATSKSESPFRAGYFAGAGDCLDEQLPASSALKRVGLEVRILVLRGDARVADKHIEKAGNLYIENYTGFYTLDARFNSA